MNRDASRDNQDRLDAFAEVARQVRGPLSARQRSAGWQRLQETLASERSLRDEPPRRWWAGRGLRLAFALVAIVIPLGWRVVKRAGPDTLQYVVSREGGSDAIGATGGVLSSQAGHAQLLFTDGSRIGMRPAARLTVAALKAKGSDLRLLDGFIDVDVRHQPDAAWTFEAGPYTVRVRGTSFALGWDAAQKRLQLKMRSGVVALLGPATATPLMVTGGESVVLDEGGNPPPPTARDEAPAEAPPTGSAPRPVAPERRLARSLLAHAQWAPLLARGDFDAIVDQAKKTGLDVCLGSDTEPNLAALADAARYTHRNDLARRSLLALRSRFPSTDRARDAAFFLARLSETPGPDATEALSWYERYLREGASGSYAEEALGREMILLRRSGGGAAAGHAAARYLKAYPHGLYANEAAGLIESSSAR